MKSIKLERFLKRTSLFAKITIEFLFALAVYLFLQTVKSFKKYINGLVRVLVIGVFLGLAILSILMDHYGITLGNSELDLLFSTAIVNFGPELAGIVISVALIDYMNKRRNQSELKIQLIRQMRSRFNEVSDTAIQELRANGWLQDGSVREAFLQSANLQGANLEGANLKMVDMWGANLQEVNLKEADLSISFGVRMLYRPIFSSELLFLRGARLIETNLQDALLRGAKLRQVRFNRSCLRNANLTNVKAQEASFENADLKNASLASANLEKANFKGANLEGCDFTRAFLYRADFEGARNWTIQQFKMANSLNEAIMPDGKIYEEWIKENQIQPTNQNLMLEYLDEQISDNHAAQIRKYAKLIAKNSNSHPNSIHANLRKKFGYSSYKEINFKQFREVMKFLATLLQESKH